MKEIIEGIARSVAVNNITDGIITGRNGDKFVIRTGKGQIISNVINIGKDSLQINDRIVIGYVDGAMNKARILGRTQAKKLVEETIIKL